MVEVTGLYKDYGTRRVLDVPSFRFRKNVSYALMGANGSGKSTLLRILAGVLKADGGRVERHAKGTQIGYQPQTPYAFRMSVLKNVEMALPRSPEREALAAEALKRVGMENFLSARGDALSGGETQRMALARMLACPRELVLLDEPTSAADIAGIDRIESALLEYRRECGCTLIFSTHAPSQAMRLADEVLFLENGVIVEHGPAERVLHHPESAQVQTFLKHWRI